MTGLLQRLPSTLGLALLAAVFLIMRRKQVSARVRLWAWGWTLVLLHLALRLLLDMLGVSPWTAALAYSSLICAAIAFALSTTPIAERSTERRNLILLLGTPAVVLSCVPAIGSSAWWLSVLATAAFFFGPIVYFTRKNRVSLPMLLGYAVLALGGIASCYQIFHNNSQFPFWMALALLFGFAAVLYRETIKRMTAGRFLTLLGFVGLTIVFSIAAFPIVIISVDELWNVSSYLLAFGMILVLTEDERATVNLGRESERSITQQLESFAEVTSRLLSGEDVRSLGGYIAQVVTKVTTFQRVAILLADEQQQMYIAGYAGISEQEMRELERVVVKFTPQEWASFGQQGRLVGRTSFVFSHPHTQITDGNGRRLNPFWQPDDELLVPIRSPRGLYAGFISLNQPRDLTRVNSAEMSKLEMLANDVGVAIERAYLQRELVRSEKLAGVGQLVAGMAHELNNPLTAVLGYAEMLGETEDAQVQQQASVIQRESLRMKRIIDNLVRFAKQDKAERSLLSVNQTLEEVLKLWKSQAKASGIQMDVQVQKDLPRVRFDEAQLKQVFLNLLNNAYEAVADSEEKRITVSAAFNYGIVSITVTDTGSGFQDPERVFDPFFTTKAVGKGTGLGLSVCYGIVKQHGGDIRAFNTKPHGAGVTMEVPVAQQELALSL